MGVGPGANDGSGYGAGAGPRDPSTLRAGPPSELLRKVGAFWAPVCDDRREAKRRQRNPEAAMTS